MATKLNISRHTKKNLLKLTKTASCQSHFDPSQQLGCDETNNTRGKKLKQKKEKFNDERTNEGKGKRRRNAFLLY